ncbi:MAG: tetratricopeptide repeat protein [Bacteriovoracaceae bacterium]|nr:tetratricopeptide repeat protein [Bacteriovoracaceae bacterium]
MITLPTEELINKGIDCYTQGDLKKAQAFFNEVVEVDGRSIDAFFHLANIFHVKGEIGKAIKAFNKVLSLDPGHTDAAISLSVLYNDIGKYEEAKKVFNIANERVKTGGPTGELLEDSHVNKKFSLKHFEIAEMYMSYNRYDEALFEYNKSAALDIENYEIRVKIAKVYAKKGFISKAFEELRKLKNEQPSYIPARLALGILHYGNGNIIEAQAEWEKVLVKEPKNDEAKMYLNLAKTATETTL